MTNVYLVKQWQESTLGNNIFGDEVYWGSTVHVFTTLDEAEKCAKTLNKEYAEGVVLSEDGLFEDYDETESEVHYYTVEEIELFDEWEKTRIYNDFYKPTEEK